MSFESIEIPDEWEFYPCLVDNEPASILLNMWYRENHEGLGLETLYFSRIDMLDPDEHGMGSKQEADALFEIEDLISNEVLAMGMLNVGRLRNDGGWQLTFYGPEGQEEQLAEACRLALGPRTFSTDSKTDSEWNYYNDFLYPDRERMHWIANRRQVETLVEHGDVIEAERPIDHFVYFLTPESRAQFVASLPSNGFPESQAQEHSGDVKDPYIVQVIRTDTVELGHLHDVVMDLANLAEKYGGDYDGWGAPIVQLENDPNVN